MDTGAGMVTFDAPVTVAKVVADSDVHESGVQIYPSYGQPKYQVCLGRGGYSYRFVPFWKRGRFSGTPACSVSHGTRYPNRGFVLAVRDGVVGKLIALQRIFVPYYSPRLVL